jgi:hypothetical protein
VTPVDRRNTTRSRTGEAVERAAVDPHAPRLAADDAHLERLELLLLRVLRGRSERRGRQRKMDRDHPLTLLFRRNEHVFLNPVAVDALGAEGR